MSVSPKLMIWCTCANTDDLRYYDRVVKWYKHVKSFPVVADLYVFNDGPVSDAGKRHIAYDNSNNDITWIEEAEPLCRKSIRNFPGWRRAFAHAMFVSLNYDYCCHIENDVRILNVPEVCSWMYTKGTYAFYDLHYNIIESAIMCLNDVDVRRAYATVFSQTEMQHSDTMFEEQLENLTDSPVSILNSYRLEGRPPEAFRGKNLDALCQVGTDYD